MSILFQLLKDIFLTRRKQGTKPTAEDVLNALGPPVKRVLNVGGNSKAISIPSHYNGWQHDLLDIDPGGNPDIVCDARKLTSLQGAIYDAVYCSHNLEHYYRSHGMAVVKGFHHMLKEDGFAEIRVPDISKVIKAMYELNLGLDDMIYVSPAGPISAHDIIYGFQAEIERSGQDFYAHKTGFTTQSLTRTLLEGGFKKLIVRSDDSVEPLAIHALAFKEAPREEHYSLLKATWDIQPNQLISG